MATQRIGRIQWGDLTMGTGTRYHITTAEGIDDLPDVRTTDTAREGQHGDYTGPDTVGPRIVQLGLTLRADTPDELRQLVLDLQRATQPQRTPAALQLLDWNWLAWAKVRRRAVPYDAEGLWRTGTAALEFYCADPHLYAIAPREMASTAYSPSAGRAYARAYPYTYGSTGSSGRIQAVNSGTAPTWPVLRIDGPVATPLIEQTNTGSGLTIDATLQAGEVLIIDTRSRAVLFMGDSSRRSWVRAGSTWPLLLPGTNELVYRGSTLPGAPDQPSVLTVTWRDASL